MVSDEKPINLWISRETLPLKTLLIISLSLCSNQVSFCRSSGERALQCRCRQVPEKVTHRNHHSLHVKPFIKLMSEGTKYCGSYDICSDEYCLFIIRISILPNRLTRKQKLLLSLLPLLLFSLERKNFNFDSFVFRWLESDEITTKRLFNWNKQDRTNSVHIHVRNI